MPPIDATVFALTSTLVFVPTVMASAEVIVMGVHLTVSPGPDTSAL